MKRKAETTGGLYAVFILLFVFFIIELFLIGLSFWNPKSLNAPYALVELFKIFKLEFTIGGLVLFLAAFYFGRKAGRLIILQNERDTYIGFVIGLKILLLSSSMGSMAGLFRICFENDCNWIIEILYFVVRPIFSIMLLGILPSLFLGILYEKMLIWKSKRLMHNL